MSYSPGDVLGQYLIGLSLGSLPSDRLDWPLYTSSIPIDGDQLIGIYDTTGLMDGRNLATGERYTHPGFQLLARSPDYLLVYSKILSIALALDAIVRQVITMPDTSQYRIESITRLNDPIKLEEEKERRREVLVFNGRMTLVTL
jgi:hypothetical protein